MPRGDVVPGEEANVRDLWVGSMLSALLVTALAGAAPAAPAPAPEPKTSPEFSGYTYMEKSGEYTVLVYSWLASYRRTEAFIPLVVAVGRVDEKHKKGETAAEKKAARATVTFQLGDFKLTDSKGKSYAPATLEQIQKEYKFLLSDKDMLSEEPMSTGNLFNESGFMDAVFYPVDGGGRFATGAIELETWSYLETTLYFPRPEAGLDGVMTLTLGSEAITPPIRVKFKLPEPHEKKEKKEKSS